MKQIKFTVFGEPVAKGRPRLGRHGVYTPTKTSDYEQLVKLSYLKTERVKFFDNEALEIILDIFMSIPKSASKKLAKDMRDGTIRPIKRPDVDNCTKIQMDSLNGLAYKDDSQIVCCRVNKYYADEPRVEVIIQEA